MRIVQYAPGLQHWGRLNPKCLTEDVPSPAGSEIAMMSVSRALAARGHDVTVYADCDTGLIEGVKYYRPELALPMLMQVETDVIVSWQDPQLFFHQLKTGLRVVIGQSAHLDLGPSAIMVDRYFGISRKSAEILLTGERYGEPEKMWVTRNGVSLARFGWKRVAETWVPPRGLDKRKNRKHIVWASSPDRGLQHLVDIFLLVRKAVPDAKLTVCYDFDKAYDGVRKMSPGSVFLRNLDRARALKEMDGVEVVQHLSQPRLAQLYLNAGMLAYPCDPVRPTETYCVTVNEAMAAGCPVIISNADCLPENYGTAACCFPRPIDHEAWANKIVELMTDDKAYACAQAASLKLAAVTDYTEVAEEWEAFFSNYFAGHETTVDRGLAARLGR
jgi:glycosyltransferase involved in cell wall biosynthesis